jgi:hypothetical protein
VNAPTGGGTNPSNPNHHRNSTKSLGHTEIRSPHTGSDRIAKTAADTIRRAAADDGKFVGARIWSAVFSAVHRGRERLARQA